MFINLVNLSSKITMDYFSHMGGKLGEVPNKIRETLSRMIIRFFLEKYE